MRTGRHRPWEIWRACRFYFCWDRQSRIAGEYKSIKCDWPPSQALPAQRPDDHRPSHPPRHLELVLPTPRSMHHHVLRQPGTPIRAATKCDATTRPTDSLRTQWTSHGSDARIRRAVQKSRKAPQSTLARTLTRAHTHTHAQVITQARTRARIHTNIIGLPIYRSVFSPTDLPNKGSLEMQTPFQTTPSQPLRHKLTLSCLPVIPLLRRVSRSPPHP